MARGVSWGGISLPITDASISSSREPVTEQSMNGAGGTALYGGLYSAAQGSFGGAYRPGFFQSLMKNMLDDTVDSAAVIVWDDNNNALQAATAYISSAEISMRVGELAKCTFSFVGQSIAAGATGTVAVYTEEVPVFYKSCSTWGSCSEFTIRVERPYAADDYILCNDQFYSQSIYQSGDTKVTGTIKLSQAATITTGDPGTITLTLGYASGATVKTITITEAVLSNLEMGINGRGLINKTKAWACPTDCVTFA